MFGSAVSSPAPAPPSSFSSEDKRAVEPASSLTRLAPVPPFSSSFSSEDGEKGVELLLARAALVEELLLASKKIHKRYSCTTCGKRFPTPSKLRIHERTHSGERPFPCSICLKAFKTAGNLKAHQAIHNEEKKKEIRKRFPCTTCGKRFRTPSLLQIHERTHSGERPFPCSICLKAFKTAGNLKGHEVIHSDERPYQCVVCLRRFKLKCNLIKHQRLHTGEKAFLCLECGYSCPLRTTMEIHKQTHIPDKPRPFICIQCSHTFTSSKKLKYHERAVHGDTKFCCPICLKELSCQGSLNRHQRVHTGERPYSCLECGHAFSSASSLKKHLIAHELSKSWKIVCNYAEYATDPNQEGLPCRRRFSTPIALDYHIQASHTVEGLRRRLETENQMARFFEHNGICFLRDWQNVIMHANCPQLALPGRLSRPDFFLPELSVPLGARVIVENDEFAHRGYPSECELSRILKITSALSAEEDQQASRYVFIRFNPHFYTKNGVQFDPSLETRQKALLQLFADLRSGAVPTQDEGLTLIYLFYDEIEGRLCLFKNSDSELSSIFEEIALIYV